MSELPRVFSPTGGVTPWEDVDDKWGESPQVVVDIPVIDERPRTAGDQVNRKLHPTFQSLKKTTSSKSIGNNSFLLLPRQLDDSKNVLVQRENSSLKKEVAQLRGMLAEKFRGPKRISGGGQFKNTQGASSNSDVSLSIAKVSRSTVDIQKYTSVVKSNNELESKVTQLEKKVNILNAERKRFSSSAADTLQLEGELLHVEDRYENALNQLDARDKEISQYKEELKFTKRMVSDKQQEIKQIETQLADAIANTKIIASSVQVEMRTLTKILGDSNSRENSLKQQLHEISNKSILQEQQINSKDLTIEAVQVKNEELSNQVATIEGINVELECALTREKTLRNTIHEKTLEVEQCHREIRNHVKEFEKEQNHANKCSQQIEEMEKRILEKSEQISSLQNELDQLQSLKESALHRDVEFEHAQNEVVQLQLAAGKLVEERDRLQNSNFEFESDCNRLKLESARHENELKHIMRNCLEHNNSLNSNRDGKVLYSTRYASGQVSELVCTTIQKLVKAAETSSSQLKIIQKRSDEEEILRNQEKIELRELRKEALEKALHSMVRLCVVAPTVNVNIKQSKSKVECKPTMPSNEIRSVLQQQVLPIFTKLFIQSEKGIAPDGITDMDEWLGKLLSTMQANIESHLLSAFS